MECSSECPIIIAYQMNPAEQGLGGGVRYVRNILEELKRRRIPVVFFGCGGVPIVEETFEYVPLSPKYITYPRFLWRLWLALAQRPSLKGIVHVHRLYFTAPFLLHPGRFRTVCTLHGRTFSVFRQRFGYFPSLLAEPLFRRIERFCLERVDRIVFISRDVEETFLEHHSEAKQIISQRSECLGSMIDLQAFFPEPSDFVHDLLNIQGFIILFLGRLAQVKNIPLLIRSYARYLQSYEDIHLVIAGTGEDEAEVRALAQSLCDNRLPHFIGEVRPSDVPRLLNAASALVLCSHHEGSPTVVKEALSCGTPVVSTAVGDVADFIEEGQNGHIVPPKEEALAEAILKVRSCIPSRLSIHQAVEIKLRRFSPVAVATHYLNLYDSLRQNLHET